MDGSYNHGFQANPAQTNSPMSPVADTPTSAYKANVNRQKTRKWVEAKQQNYDGDDWGNEFDDEEAPPPLPAVAAARLPPRAASSSPASTSSFPIPSRAEQSNLAAPASEETSRNVSGPPPLQIQTQPAPALAQPPQPPQPGLRMSPAPQSGSSAKFPPRKSSISGEGDAPGSSRQSAAGSRPGSSHKPWTEAPRSASPHGARSPGTPTSKPLAFVRPADIYRRMEEEKEKERRRSMESNRSRLSMDSTREAAPVAADSSSLPAKPPAETEQGRLESGAVKAAPADAPRSVRPPLETVAERKSEYGFDRLVETPVQSQAHESTTPATRDVGKESEKAPLQQRFSQSPRLPDVARMSGFGEDFFSMSTTIPDTSLMPKLPPSTFAQEAKNQSLGATEDAKTTSGDPERSFSTTPPGSQVEASAKTDAADAAKIPEKSALRPSLPGAWISETPSLATPQPPESASKALVGADVSPITDNEEDGRPEALGGTVKTAPAAPAPPPLQTSALPSQQPMEVSASSTTASPQVPQSSTTEVMSAVSTITPTAPLKPKLGAAVDDDFVPPPVLHRESTLSTTASGTLKESDKLREEIIQSLSPIRPTGSFSEWPASDTQNAQPQSPQQSVKDGIRESTYLPAVYDDYWAATSSNDDKADNHDRMLSADDRVDSKMAEKPTTPPGGDRPQHTSQPGESDTTNEETPRAAPAPLTGPESDQDASPAPSAGAAAPARPEARERFSWELDAEEVSKAASKPPNKVATVPSEPPDPAKAQTIEATPSQPSPAPDLAPESKADPDNEGSHSKADVSSQASSTNAAALKQVVDIHDLEPPSPISTPEPRRMSLADEKKLVHESEAEVAPSPVQHPALQQPSAPVPTGPGVAGQEIVKPLGFRDIMNMEPASERIAKFDETRAQFIAMDSGLSNWLAMLKSQPEHANASAVFSGGQVQIPPGGAPMQNPMAPGVGPQSDQNQPYYQQYLNASSPTTGTPNRPMMMTPSSQSPTSDFRHSSGQMGAKGKGLLLAAGKAGKGLLSKGKNKLRGGDKDDGSPPPPLQGHATHDHALLHSQVQAPSKPPGTGTERRTSWGIKFGVGKSHSAEKSAPIPRNPSPASSGPPQLPPASRMSPFNALSQSEDGSPWQRPATPPKKLPDAELVSPVSGANSGPSIPPIVPGVPLTPKSEDTPTAEAPQRHTSFVGLPPIRRSSTFGRKLSGGLGDAEEPLDSSRAEPKLGAITDLPSPSHQLQTPPTSGKAPELARQDAHDADEASQILVPAADVGGRTPKVTLVVDTKSSLNPKAPAAKTPSPVPGPSNSRLPPQPDISQPQPSPHLPPGGWKIQESHLAEPLMRKRTPSTSSQNPPLSGFDKETGLSSDRPESHDGSSTHDMDSVHERRGSDIKAKGAEEKNKAPATGPGGPGEFEKDTEEELRPPSAPHPSTLPQSSPQPAMPQPLAPPFTGASPQFDQGHTQSQPPAAAQDRTRVVNHPPLSSQRFPGLFDRHSQQQPQQQLGGPGPQYPMGPPGPRQDMPSQFYQAPIHPNNAMVPRAQTSEFQLPGVGPPQQPAGHSDQAHKRGSGIFTQIGERFHRTSRPNSYAEPRAHGDVTGDGVSEASVNSDDIRRRRTSFLNFKSNTGGNITPRSRDSMLAQSPGTLDQRSAGATAPGSPQEEKKPSFFKGITKTATSSSGKLITGLTRSSTTEVSTGNENKGKHGRFAGLAGVFRRNTGERDGMGGPPNAPGTAPGTAHSMVSMQGHQTGNWPPRTPQGHLGPPGPPGPPGPSPLRPFAGPPSSPSSSGPPGGRVAQAHGTPPPQAPGPLQGPPQPSQLLPPSSPGRARSGTTGSIPTHSSPLQHGSSPAQPQRQSLQPPQREERGRKISGPGAFLSNILGARSSSKTREGKTPPLVPPQQHPVQFQGPVPGPSFSRPMPMPGQRWGPPPPGQPQQPGQFHYGPPMSAGMGMMQQQQPPLAGQFMGPHPQSQPGHFLPGHIQSQLTPRQLQPGQMLPAAQQQSPSQEHPAPAASVASHQRQLSAPTPPTVPAEQSSAGLGPKPVVALLGSSTQSLPPASQQGGSINREWSPLPQQGTQSPPPAARMDVPSPAVSPEVPEVRPKPPADEPLAPKPAEEPLANAGAKTPEPQESALSVPQPPPETGQDASKHSPGQLPLEEQSDTVAALPATQPRAASPHQSPIESRRTSTHSFASRIHSETSGQTTPTAPQSHSPIAQNMRTPQPVASPAHQRQPSGGLPQGQSPSRQSQDRRWSGQNVAPGQPAPPTQQGDRRLSGQVAPIQGPLTQAQTQTPTGQTTVSPGQHRPGQGPPQRPPIQWGMSRAEGAQATSSTPPGGPLINRIPQNFDHIASAQTPTPPPKEHGESHGVSKWFKSITGGRQDKQEKHAQGPTSTPPGPARTSPGPVQASSPPRGTVVNAQALPKEGILQGQPQGLQYGPQPSQQTSQPQALPQQPPRQQQSPQGPPQQQPIRPPSQQLQSPPPQHLLQQPIRPPSQQLQSPPSQQLQNPPPQHLLQHPDQRPMYPGVVAGHLQPGPLPQSKPEKTSPGKSIFGVFKRSSKQAETASPPNASFGGQPPQWQGHPLRPGMPPQQGQFLMPPGQFAPGVGQVHAQQGMPPQFGRGQFPAGGPVPGQPPTGPNAGTQRPPGPPSGQSFTQQPVAFNQTFSRPGMPPQPPSQYLPPQPQTVRAVNEPQYDQVPIPGAYRAVHGEGIQVPTPYNVGRGQQQQQQQYLGYPGMSRQVSQASSYYSQQPSMHGRQPSGAMSMLSQPSVGRQLSTNSAFSNTSAPPPPQIVQNQAQAQGQPQTQGVNRPTSGASMSSAGPPPASNSSPALQTAQTAQPAMTPPQTDKPLPDPNLQVPRQQRRESDASNPSAGNTAAKQDGDAPSVAQNKDNPGQAADEDQPDRNPTPTPAPRSAARNRLGLDTSTEQTRISNDTDEATPLKPLPAASEEAKGGAGSGSSTNQPNKANGSPPATTLTRGKSNRAELEDTEDDRLRNIRREAQEEKILVGESDNAGATKGGPNAEEAEAPMMSATSYPGQEWNPYAMGAFDDDE